MSRGETKYYVSNLNPLAFYLHGMVYISIESVTLRKWHFQNQGIQTTKPRTPNPKQNKTITIFEMNIFEVSVYHKHHRDGLRHFVIWLRQKRERGGGELWLGFLF